MQTTLERTRLRVAYWCHLPPLTFGLPHVPLNRNLFPSAQEGFDDFTMAREAHYFGSAMALVDISGLTRAQIRDDPMHLGSVPEVRFLQCLEYMKDRLHELRFERFVAYLGSHVAPVVAVPVDGVFRRVPAPEDSEPWAIGTFGLFHQDSL